MRKRRTNNLKFLCFIYRTIIDPAVVYVKDALVSYGNRGGDHDHLCNYVVM
jgi:hypothetical protein